VNGSFHELVVRYGYAVVVLFVGAEGVGVPLPGETALLAAAALAARGHLSIMGVILASAVGVAAGGSGGYWIGRSAGQVVVARYGRWVGITPERLDRTREFFALHGAHAVLVARFVPIVRILAGLVAGITEMPFAQFATYNAVAGVIWSLLFGFLGYSFGRNLPLLEHRLGEGALVIGAIVLMVGLALLAWRRTRGRDQRSGIRSQRDQHMTGSAAIADQVEMGDQVKQVTVPATGPSDPDP
jgi:membrane protein DedA with SNARE-associated domain